MSISVSYINTSSPKYQQVWTLREEILRKPLGLSLRNEDLSRDHIDTIFIAEDGDKVVGCLMMHHLNNDEIQLRAMAVYDSYQGKGVGRLLVEVAERFSAEKGYGTIVLHARKVAVGFYKSMNYTVTSDEFREVGIPHFMMEKRLDKQ